MSFHSNFWDSTIANQNKLVALQGEDRVKSYTAAIVNRSQTLEEKVARLRVLASPEAVGWLTGKVAAGDSGVSPSPESVAIEFEHTFQPPTPSGNQLTSPALGMATSASARASDAITRKISSGMGIERETFSGFSAVEMRKRAAELLNKKNALERFEVEKAAISEKESNQSNPWAQRTAGLAELDKYMRPLEIDGGDMLSKNWLPPAVRRGADGMQRHFESHPSFVKSGTGPGETLIDGETVNAVTGHGGPKMAKAARVMTAFFDKAFGK